MKTLFPIFFLIISCSVNNDSCDLQSLLTKTTNHGESSEGIKIRNQLNDSLDYWLTHLDTSLVNSFIDNNFLISNRILFNSNFDQIITFIIEPRKQGEQDDVVQLITGEKIKGEWNFYLLGNPSFLYTKCKNCDQKFEPISIEELENKTIENIIKLGYVTENCHSNVDQHIIDFQRIDHKHRFLSGTYPKYDSNFYKYGIQLPSNK